jgi:hypothetical protein
MRCTGDGRATRWSLDRARAGRWRVARVIPSCLRSAFGRWTRTRCLPLLGCWDRDMRPGRRVTWTAPTFLCGWSRCGARDGCPRLSFAAITVHPANRPPPFSGSQQNQATQDLRNGRCPARGPSGTQAGGHRGSPPVPHWPRDWPHLHPRTYDAGVKYLRCRLRAPHRPATRPAPCLSISQSRRAVDSWTELARQIAAAKSRANAWAARFRRSLSASSHLSYSLREQAAGSRQQGRLGPP